MGWKDALRLVLEPLGCKGTELPGSLPCSGKSDPLAKSLTHDCKNENCAYLKTFSVERMNHSSSQGQTYVLLAFPSLIFLPYLEKNSVFLFFFSF